MKGDSIETIIKNSNAYDRGYKAGYNLLPTHNNPYPPSDTRYGEWLQGHIDAYIAQKIETC